MVVVNAAGATFSSNGRTIGGVRAEGINPILRVENVGLYLCEHTDLSLVNKVDPIAQHFGVVPDDMPWARDIEVTDPDGNRLRIGEAKQL